MSLPVSVTLNSAPGPVRPSRASLPATVAAATLVPALTPHNMASPVNVSQGDAVEGGEAATDPAGEIRRPAAIDLDQSNGLTAAAGAGTCSLCHSRCFFVGGPGPCNPDPERPSSAAPPHITATVNANIAAREAAAAAATASMGSNRNGASSAGTVIPEAVADGAGFVMTVDVTVQATDHAAVFTDEEDAEDSEVRDKEPTWYSYIHRDGRTIRLKGPVADARAEIDAVRVLVLGHTFVILELQMHDSNVWWLVYVKHTCDPTKCLSGAHSLVPLPLLMMSLC